MPGVFVTAGLKDSAPLNGTVTRVPIRVNFRVGPASRFVLMHVMEQSMETLRGVAGSQGASEEGALQAELEQVMAMVTDAPLWLLGLTFMVSIVHLWLDVMAVRTDVSFWAQAKSLRGVSISTLFTQLVSEMVITVYLWDQGASWLVLSPAAAFSAIQLWKVLRALGTDVELRYGCLPCPRSNQAFAASATESHTNVHDSIATRHVMACLAPVIAGFALFSLVRQEHESWTKWALQVAVSLVYGLGFALMTPQLYVNYKLKSVAAMNWQTLIYRTLNTFIDDLFAFIIKMPTMHRLAVFRDDLVFVAFMYQRWIYPEDLSRKQDDRDD
jgi:hypothetical protein